MNKRGSVFFGVAIALVLYMAGVLFIPFITDDIDTARSDLSCSDSSISDGAKLNCLMTDAVIPYFIWFFISTALAVIAGVTK